MISLTCREIINAVNLKLILRYIRSIIKFIGLKLFNTLKIMVLFKDKYTVLIIAGIIFCWYWFSFDMSFFARPTSTVLMDRRGELLGAKLAADGCWRFPMGADCPVLFQQLIVQQEDEFFYFHPGINPVSMAKAFLMDIKTGKLKYGASTISMQVIRMYRGYKKRTILEKTIEFFLALRMEGHLSKKQIIQLYAFNASFGSNIVGLEAASWKYYGKKTSQLNLSQMAVLALLPGNPALGYSLKKHELIRHKRNRLLANLLKNKIIDKVEFDSANKFPLPKVLKPMPNYAPHFLELIQKDKGLKGQLVNSSIDKNIQVKVAAILQNYSDKLQQVNINNGAIIIMDPYLNKPLAYVGNTRAIKKRHENDVDMIQAQRSAGKILTPFLYALMLSDGLCTPEMIISGIGKEKPDKYFADSRVSCSTGFAAKEILSHKFNCSVTDLLDWYGAEKFYFKLRQLGHNFLTKPYSHYGNSLISGGSETSLWRLACNYATMVKVLEKESSLDKSLSETAADYPFQASAIYSTFDAMKSTQIDISTEKTKSIKPNKNMAWKVACGTKSRDSWAIAASPQFVVCVWLGNTNGSGNPLLMNNDFASSLLFDVSNYLNPNKWFRMPVSKMSQVYVCKQSGLIATSQCQITNLTWVPRVGLKTSSCMAHN